MDISKEAKMALNSIYGRKSITDMNVQCAISEKIDLSKPEDVVLALGYAYAYMYHREDNVDADRILAKLHELFNIYDMTTGKPLPKDDKKDTERRLMELEKSVVNLVNNTNEALVAIENLKKQDAGIKNRLYKLERWKALFTEEDKTNDKS